MILQKNKQNDYFEQTDVNNIKTHLRETDMNRASIYSSEISKEDIQACNEEEKLAAQPMISAEKIQESFHNNNIDVYLLANPFSGSNEAKHYTTLPMENYRFTLEGGNEVFMRIVDITKRDKMDEAKEYIKTSIHSKFNTDLDSNKVIKISKYGQKVIIVICGGDGSFMNIVQEFKEDAIDIDKLVFTQFPFGTANDIPNSFGWGRKPPKQMLTNLFRVCKEVIEAKEVYFDIWEIIFKVNESEGDILIPGGKMMRSICTKVISKIM